MQEEKRTLDMFNTEIRLCDSVAIIDKGIVGEVWDIPNPEQVKVRVQFKMTDSNELQAQKDNSFELVSSNEIVTRNTRPHYNVNFS